MSTIRASDIECRKCYRRHRSWSKLAECRFCPGAHDWAAGTGRYVSVAFCPRGVTAFCYGSMEDALNAKAQIDRTGCGGMCCRNHRIYDLAEGHE